MIIMSEAKLHTKLRMADASSFSILFDIDFINR